MGGGYDRRIELWHSSSIGCVLDTAGIHCVLLEILVVFAGIHCVLLKILVVFAGIHCVLVELALNPPRHADCKQNIWAGGTTVA